MMTDTPIDLRVDYAADANLRAALLALNNAHAVELSLADGARMAMLVERAFLAARIGKLDAALIAFDQDADYDSANFHWFRERYPRFVYVDRIVTAPEARGRGLARKLYAHLFEQARAAGHERVVCEVNSDPPNPASEVFHQAIGFEPVGEALLENGKTVTYLAHTLRR
ncbi:GNAT family N-acetyltransferase [Novosphingobium sp. BL-8H]|uniref:GNAT family N-acetyltransferase n=1 Tax=Novosphingobium sp. BL-8H TaxID=3127640 RepID=UPI0037562EDE